MVKLYLWTILINLVSWWTTISRVNSTCYLPDGCRFLDDIHNHIEIKPVHILCTKYHASFDSEKFNQTYEECQTATYLNSSDLTVIIKADTSNQILDNSPQLINLKFYQTDGLHFFYLVGF